jgi:hypothetical protein
MAARGVLPVAARQWHQGRRLEISLSTGTPVGLAIWIIIILVIAALLKYLLTDNSRK